AGRQTLAMPAPLPQPVADAGAIPGIGRDWHRFAERLRQLHGMAQCVAGCLVFSQTLLEGSGLLGIQLAAGIQHGFENQVVAARPAWYQIVMHGSAPTATAAVSALRASVPGPC